MNEVLNIFINEKLYKNNRGKGLPVDIFIINYHFKND